ncbi:MAG: hypothetical protein KDA58_15940 [Planctomycetaceae bacterium]|nr:hypothetical protein [Planctomycetaceae bacterium]
MDYKFRPLGKICAQTGEPLRPGEPCISVLLERDGVFERLDYNTAVWSGPPENAVGYWQCQVPHPEVRQANTVDPEVLMRLFEQMVDEQQASRERLLYVLTLFLLQRRRLKLEGTQSGEDGRDWLEVFGNRGEGPYLVPDQQLSQDEIKELQAALTAQLNTEWEAA